MIQLLIQPEAVSECPGPHLRLFLGLSVLTPILSQQLVKLETVCAAGTGQTRLPIGHHVSHCTQYCLWSWKASEVTENSKVPLAVGEILYLFI